VNYQEFKKQLAYQDFERLFNLKEKLSNRFFEIAPEMEDRLDNELKLAYFVKFPRRRKWDRNKSLTENTDQHNEIFTKWQKRADRIWNNYKLRRDEIEAELVEIAQTLPIIPSENVWTRFYITGTWNYSSQGYGAYSYAKGAAENKSLEVTANGLDFHIAINEKGLIGHYGIRSADFTVWVNTDQIGMEILKRKPSISLRDWVKNCWKSGKNPRVYNPFLPEGLEAKLGIDFFGNDIK